YELFFAVKWLGAAYLVFLGLRAILWRRVEGAPPVTPRRRRVFLSALGVQLANPKATLFVVAILPQFIDPAAPVVPQMALLGLTMAVIEFGVLMGYALAASRTARFVIVPRFAGLTDKIAGAVLIGAGAGLAMVRRNG
ncbi:MAG TPA: LysE family transporter, partial [Stellaceae bacterium]|nr:LysE family transporter [Stellaceae bacterium]